MLHIHFLDKHTTPDDIPCHLFLSKSQPMYLNNIDISSYFDPSVEDKTWIIRHIMINKQLFHIILWNTSIPQNTFSLIKMAHQLAKQLQTLHNTKIMIHHAERSKNQAIDDQWVLHFTKQLILGQYTFEKFKTTHTNKTLEHIYIQVKDKKACTTLWKPYSNIIESVITVRDAVNTPANFMSPEDFVALCTSVLPNSVKLTILTKTEMQKLGFGALLGVGQGASKSPKVIIAEYNEGKGAPIAFVGKGVCFDSGGLNLKLNMSSLSNMYADMAGAGAVLGILQAVASNKLKKNVVGVIGLVENMVDGNSYHPGDILTSYIGKTIKIQNTDAEGRLVLADILAYTQQVFNPKIMIDFASLTGSIVGALGYLKAGLFSNNDDLIDSLLNSAIQSGELLWNMPLDQMGQNFDSMVQHTDADLQNTNLSLLGAAGSSVAATFLKQFVNVDPSNTTQWAHIDIAGTSFHNQDYGIVSYGATGFGVQLIMQWLAS